MELNKLYLSRDVSTVEAAIIKITSKSLCNLKQLNLNYLNIKGLERLINNLTVIKNNINFLTVKSNKKNPNPLFNARGYN